jgi:hypothetical protein
LQVSLQEQNKQLSSHVAQLRDFGRSTAVQLSDATAEISRLQELSEGLGR